MLFEGRIKADHTLKTQKHGIFGAKCFKYETIFTKKLSTFKADLKAVTWSPQ